MNPLNVNANPYLEHALAEHQDLHRVAVEIGSLLDSTSAREASVEGAQGAETRLHKLRQMLQHHFAQEEEGGYLEEAIARVPSLAPQAAALQKQHAQFILTADKLLAEIDLAQTPAAKWQLMQAGFHTYSKKLLAHEAAENGLLQRGYNVDLGMED